MHHFINLQHLREQMLELFEVSCRGVIIAAISLQRLREQVFTLFETACPGFEAMTLKGSIRTEWGDSCNHYQCLTTVKSLESSRL